MNGTQVIVLVHGIPAREIEPAIKGTWCLLSG